MDTLTSVDPNPARLSHIVLRVSAVTAPGCSFPVATIVVPFAGFVSAGGTPPVNTGMILKSFAPSNVLPNIGAVQPERDRTIAETANRLGNLIYTPRYAILPI
ncbi:MAG TPA: hypothetical protein VGU00_04605 [Sphingopyxis sp.]|nr:hypothetical protein [Sphingopyxis sp.]